MSTWIVLVAIAAVAAYAVTLYNRLVKNRQMTGEGWSGIDVQLKRRANLIPNLVETVKGYAGHERELLERVTELRAQVGKVPEGDVAGRGKLEGLLSGAIGKLLAVAENYPDLKANENFLELQETLGEVEDEIQMSRRYYNGAVRNLNVMVESFPSNLVANQFGFEKRDYFEIDDDADRANGPQGVQPESGFHRPRAHDPSSAVDPRHMNAGREAQGDQPEDQDRVTVAELELQSGFEVHAPRKLDLGLGVRLLGLAFHDHGGGAVDNLLAVVGPPDPQDHAHGDPDQPELDPEDDRRAVVGGDLVSVRHGLS